jgi:hypothetical protein
MAAFANTISYDIFFLHQYIFHIRYIFDNNVLLFYLDRPLNYIYKPYICKMRISAHNLNIETGIFYNLDRHERVCSMCNLNDQDKIVKHYCQKFICINDI